MKRFFTFTETLVETLRAFADTNDCQALALAAEMFPELAAIFESGNQNAAAFAIEHGQAADNLLWAHLENVLARRLMGVETRDMARFDNSCALDQTRFDKLCDIFENIDKSLHLAHVLRAALVFSDVSKGGSAQRRAEWTSEFGMDLRVHNEASAILLEKTALLNRYPEFRHSDVLQQTIILMVRYHGFVGQYVRGEITGDAFAPVIADIRNIASKLQEHLQFDSFDAAADAIVRLYWMMNVLDTAGVRDKLMDSALFDKFEAVAAQIRDAVTNTAPFPVMPVTDDIPTIRQLLETRMMPLRGGTIAAGESPDEMRQAIAAIDDDRIRGFYNAMRLCQLWYFEAATGRLSASGQLKLLAMGIHLFTANHANQMDIFHLDFIDIANIVSPKAPNLAPEVAKSRANYRIRILDAILALQDINRILDGTADIYNNPYIFTMTGQFGNQRSLTLDLSVSDESEALITLLSIYERKSAVSFHSALKMLCDLYHLRKDDFDRLSNESQYLVTMNAAKNDKARMMRFLKPGRIVEVGPGGGVVLDLLEKHFPDSDIIGLDASHQVVVALEQRKKQNQAKWQIIEGNAFEFQRYFPAESLDSIVFCSILHEIYSYIEAEDGSRFHIESVKKMLQSAFDALAPGGRILIRDGVMPPHNLQYLTFLADDAKPFFDAFCSEFKGRPISFQTIDENTVLLDAADAMEFMYTYTWGPESFPYEVREQYGILTYEDYCASVQVWLGDRARLVKIPDDEALVLQPGYVTALKDKVRLTDYNGNPAPFPPSNAIIVIEKN